MKIYNQTDKSILEELARRLNQARLDQNMTQEELARTAAVSKRTIERLETGTSVQLSNLIRVLRALHLMQNLDQLVPPSGPRPIEQLKHHGKARRRASSMRETPHTPWTWNDKS